MPDRAFTAEERQAYALAVIRKQMGADDQQAAKVAEQLGAEKLEELHDAGREGRVADCRKLLGL
jgi:hypothetical protein